MALAYTSGTALKTRMGITDSNSDAVLDARATAVNTMIESYIGGPVGSGGTAIRTFDGDGGRVLWVRHGVNGVTTLEVADQTGGTFTTLASSEYVLRPASWDRPTGWPAFRIELTDQATRTLTKGHDTVRVTPSSDGWGWTAIPAELSEVAHVLGTRLFQSRQAGEMMVVGSTDFGNAIVRFLPEPEYRDILDRFRGVISPWRVG